MAVTAESLTSPAGPLDRTVLFPRDSGAAFEERLTAYLAVAVVRAADLEDEEQDAAVTAWALYRAYRAVYERMTVGPSSATLADEGGASWTAAQIQNVKDLADGYLEEFEELVEVVVDDEDTAGGWPIVQSWRRGTS